MDKETKKRMREITAVLRKYGFGKLLNKGIKNKIFPAKEEDEYSLLDDPEFPVKLRLICQDLGTSFIKLGQLLSTRQDIVGEKIANELAKLQDDNPAVSYEEIKETVESELGGNIDDLFEYFSEESLSTASIGQVHEAKLKTGEKVAVKVQKQGISETLESDLVIMKYLAKIIHNHNDELRGFNLPGIIDAFDHSIHIEIDYINELINMTQLASNFEDDETIHIPVAYSNYTTSKVLTMEFIEGTKVSEVFESDSEEFDKPLLSKRVLDSFMRQVLIDGFYHDDPHPGNIFILENNVVCYIDLGSMGILDDDFRKNLADLLMLVADQDVKGVINQFIYMGVLDYDMDTTELKRDLRDLFFRSFNSEIGGLNDVLDKLLSLMQKYGIILPNDFVTMARGISMIENVAMGLDPNADVMASIEPIAKEIVKERVNISNFINDKKGSLLYYKNMLKSIAPLLVRSIHKLVVIIAALLISSSLVMTITRGPMLWDMPLIAVLGYLVTFILGLIGIINYLYSR